MKRSILAVAVVAVAFPLLAQQAQRGADGAISVSRQADSTASSRGGSQPPLVIVGGNRQIGTDWVEPQSGDISVGTNGGQRSVKINPKGEDVSLSRGAAATAPTVMRNGASSRWVSKSKSCPAYYTGSITWQVEERQSITNPSWTETGATRNYAENCTAIVETRWVAQSGGCPAGYSGSNTWEAEERRSGGGAWSATGATRSHSNTCAAPPPPPPPPPETGGTLPGAGCTSGTSYTFVAPAGRIVSPPASCTAANRGMQAMTMYRIRPGNFGDQSYGQWCGGGAPGNIPLTGATFMCTSSGWTVTGLNENCRSDPNYSIPPQWNAQPNMFMGLLEAFQAEADAMNAGWPGMPGGADAVVKYSCSRIDVP